MSFSRVHLGKKTQGSLQFLINRAVPLLFCLIYKSEAELCRQFPDTKTLAVKSLSLSSRCFSLSLSPRRVLSLSLPSSRGLWWWPRVWWWPLGVLVARSRLRLCIVSQNHKLKSLSPISLAKSSSLHLHLSSVVFAGQFFHGCHRTNLQSSSFTLSF
ncbi:hypothetical protein YC2023_060600 [Brassica napus]